MHEQYAVVFDEAAQLAGGGREARGLNLDQLVVADDVDHIAVDAFLDPVARFGVESFQSGVQRSFAVRG